MDQGDLRGSRGARRPAREGRDRRPGARHLTELLHYAYGKPRETIELDATCHLPDPRTLTTAELEDQSSSTRSKSPQSGRAVTSFRNGLVTAA